MLGYGPEGLLAGDAVVWLSVAAVNQNNPNSGSIPASGHFWECPFAVVLQTVDLFLLVQTPAVDVYTRTWCVLELHVAGYWAKQRSCTSGKSPLQIRPVGFIGSDVAEACENFIRENLYGVMLKLEGFFKETRLRYLGMRYAWTIPDTPRCESELDVFRRRFANQAEEAVSQFVSRHPLSIRDTSTSRPEDKQNIMAGIAGKVDNVDHAVAAMRCKTISAGFHTWLANKHWGPVTRYTRDEQQQPEIAGEDFNTRTWI